MTAHEKIIYIDPLLSKLPPSLKDKTWSRAVGPDDREFHRLTLRTDMGLTMFDLHHDSLFREPRPYLVRTDYLNLPDTDPRSRWLKDRLPGLHFSRSMNPDRKSLYAELPVRLFRRIDLRVTRDGEPLKYDASLAISPCPAREISNPNYKPPTSVPLSVSIFTDKTRSFLRKLHNLPALHLTAPPPGVIERLPGSGFVYFPDSSPYADSFRLYLTPSWTRLTQPSPKHPDAKTLDLTIKAHDSGYQPTPWMKDVTDYLRDLMQTFLPNDGKKNIPLDVTDSAYSIRLSENSLLWQFMSDPGSA